MDGEGRKMKETERGEKMRERIVFVRTFNERERERGVKGEEMISGGSEGNYTAEIAVNYFYKIERVKETR